MTLPTVAPDPEEHPMPNPGFDPPTVSTTLDAPPDGPETIRLVLSIVNRYRNRLLSLDEPRSTGAQSAIVALGDVLDELKRRFPDG